MNAPIGATRDGLTYAGFPIVADATLAPNEMAVLHAGVRTVFVLDIEAETASPVRVERIAPGGCAPPIVVENLDEHGALRQLGPGEVVALSPDDDDVLDAARWRALIGSARVRVLGSAGLTTELDPYGNPWNGYAHIGLELWTKHDAGNSPDFAVEWLTRYADVAIAGVKE